MRIPFFILLLVFILFTTYTPKKEIIKGSNFDIKKIEIINNSILSTEEIIENISFLYNENLFFLDNDNIEKKLTTLTFIETYTLKKVYPNSLRIIIKEKKPIAILQNKKKKFYISSNGELINFRYLDKFDNLPTVFGSGKSFYSFYKNLLDIKFPIEKIKSFYFFEIDRWDLEMLDGKIIKLPKNDYLISLNNFLESKNDSTFKNYKIFDYRIKDQLILN